MRRSCWLALAAFALVPSALSSLARAEGSGDLDLEEAGSFDADDQAVSASTVLRLDILNNGNEKVCWSGTGSLTLRRPDGANVAAIANDGCSNAVAGVTGAYQVALQQDQRVGSAWDIRVCASSVSNDACLDNDSNTRSGRLWSTAWDFSENTSFLERSSVNGSVYAIVPGGGDGRDAVIELQMRGVAGAFYKLRTNSTGPTSAAGVRVGHSVPRDANYSVAPEYPLYLNPPAVAKYNWLPPQLTKLQLGAQCGSNVVQGTPPGRISFSSNVIGQYVVVCDVNKDGVYDLASNRDFSSFGASIAGTNSTTWDGRDNGGAGATEGTYHCIVRLNVGEFHYVAEDIETAYPGIRMYRVEANKIDRSPLRMFWDDTSVTASENMPNGQLSPALPLATGLDPGARQSAATAFYFAGGNRADPMGNARAWGDFDSLGAGKGNAAFLDQFSAADSATSAPLGVRVLGNLGDADADGLSNARECALGSDPGSADSDGDGVRDGFEAPSAGPAPDSDGDRVPDIVDPDDDGDGVPTRAELGTGENGDGDPSDAANSDGRLPRDYLDTDADDDGVPDAADIARTNPSACRDLDRDACDDCSQSGANGSGGNVASDGVDSDGDGQCNLGDPDDDGDGVADSADHDPVVVRRCADSDGDGCDDCSAGTSALPAADGLDSDADGACDLGDPDDDGDGVPDAADAAPLDAKRCRDLDTDSCDDCSVLGSPNPDMDGADLDGDGACDAGEVELGGDADRDGHADADDLDDDGDGILDDQESAVDVSADDNGDGSPNALDLDSDGDGIYDADESGHDAVDKNADGRVDGAVGQNGVADVLEDGPDSGRVREPIDTDGDLVPDFLDVDSDADGAEDSREAGDDRASTAPLDSDADGTPDFRDFDDDDDGLDTPAERSALREDIDTDGDGLPNHRDADDDGDGVPTRSERPDNFDRDSDHDGTPDYLDADDDGDSIPTADERGADLADRDSDGDGVPDQLDPDDDGDGMPTADESGDHDHDGVPDRLQPARGTLVGGALCSTHAGAPGADSSSGWLSIAWLAALGLWRRSARFRARPRQPRSRAGGRLAARSALLGSLLSALAGSEAEAQVALEQFKPAPTASDGFGIARPDVLARGSWSTQLWIDYANDPLVYEVGKGSAQRTEKVVEHHLIGHVGFAVGVARRLTVFASLPLHILMQGDDAISADAPPADGDGLGDLMIGGRIQFSGLSPSSVFGSALELIARAPTAELFNKQQSYSGDAIGSYEPALIGELRAGRFDVRVRAGARFRRPETLGNVELGHELIGGLGMRLRLVDGLYLHAEGYGSTFLSEPFKQKTSPVETLFGIKYHGEALVVGAAGGPGVCPGFGAPDVRVVGTLGYAPREHKKPPPTDLDKDGVLDPSDRCPNAAEDKDGFEDSDGCPDVDNDKDGIADARDRCVDDPEDTDDFDDADGCPDPDNDKDGVLDPDDVCPLEPEDTDDFEDQDGCPEPDNDKDGLNDPDDQCPDQAEDVDGFEDQDGCPEPGSGLVRLTCARIEIGEAIYFDTGKDRIQSRSFALLDQVASVLSQARHILSVRVAGHSDDRGDDKRNLELSRRRAASVMRYLVVHGVEIARLSSEGYGESEPIASNKSADGRAQNRRVEFQILEQATECSDARGSAPEQTKAPPTP